MDFDRFLSTLECRKCASGFRFVPVAHENTDVAKLDGRFGILHCQCAKYPVLADIPILLERPLGMMSHWNDGAVHLNATPQSLVELLERGRCQEALLAALEFPWRLPGHWYLAHRAIWPHWLTQPVGLRITRKKLTSMLVARPKPLPLRTWLNVFFNKRSGNNPYLAEYFASKQVMPRYLSAMALVQRLPANTAPVLDLSCGMGHVVRYLTERERATDSIGLDFNFHQLWAARHIVARRGWFVCADSGEPLPFGSAMLGGIVCSDAFPYLPDKPATIAEFDRTAPRRPVIISRTGQLGVGPANPPTGGELTPSGYFELFGQHRTTCMPDNNLWKDYLERRDALSRAIQNPDDLRWEKYLSFVIHPEQLDPVPSATEQRPHAMGPLILNPAYREQAFEDGKIQLEFHFTSIWHAYEDADMTAYVQRWVTLNSHDLSDAIAGLSSELQTDFIERFILVGGTADTPPHRTSSSPSAPLHERH